MRRVPALIALPILFVRTAPARAQAWPAATGDWVEVTPRQVDGECSGTRILSWAVSQDADGTVQVRSYDDAAVPPQRLVLADGVLEGVNRGEFGGRVSWIPNHSTLRTDLDGIHPFHLVSVPAGIFIVEGLGHLGTNRGSVLEMIRESAVSRRFKHVLDLGASPTGGLLVEGDSLLVSTYRGLVRVNLRSRSVRAVDNSSLRPFVNSIVRGRDGTLWLGMRMGIARLSPTREGGYEEHWLFTPECAAHLGNGRPLLMPQVSGPNQRAKP
jgi:hypothetical protein